MTREYAILCLKGIKNYGRDIFTEQSDWQESLDMAIKALNQESALDKYRAEILHIKTKGSYNSINIDDVLTLLDNHIKGIADVNN